ncbi:FGGY-family carbohydrate kinase [Geminicoccus harenae]|uniref:FGGY-family carbohydrate kinase n=1 Tax=Geminicoccus harenae TaxID=2498453 RepID=UPI00168A8443|nr:FGGY-family carbohydrate kinase [Geminicoccus harenae]
MSLFLGIDAGGTVIKAAVFDGQGKEIAAGVAPMTNSHPQPGRSERDPLAMWEASAAAIRQVLAAPGVDAREIAAVACTGHGNGVYVFDRQMRPACPGIISSDMRTHDLCEALMASERGQELVAHSRQQLRPASTPLYLLWFDRHAPEVTRAARHVLLCKDYVRYRLTGSIDSDLNDLSGSQLVHIETRDYDAPLFEGLEISHWLERMPRIRRNSEIVGTVTPEAAAQTGLRPGTPVVAGTMDLDAVALASGVTRPGELAICAGTWSINLMVQDEPAGPPFPLMQCLDQDGSRCLVVEGSPTSATNLAWFKTGVLDDSLEFERINALVEGVPPEASRLVYLPYIHGAPGAPRGAFVGLGAENGRAEMLRALFEGVVFKHRAHVADLVRVTGRTPEVARLSGGAAKSAVWAQMFADILELPVEVAAGSELGALGSAICAAVAVGAYPGFEAAIAGMVRLERRFEPRAQVIEAYRLKADDWHKVDGYLAPAWAELGGPLLR